MNRPSAPAIQPALRKAASLLPCPWRHGLVLCAVWLLLALCCPSPLRADDGQDQVRVALGQVFEIRLAGNPTTGFMWEAASVPPLLEQVGSAYLCELPAKGTVGKGGKFIFRFRAVARGTGEVSFEYRRDGEGSTPADRTARTAVVVE